MSSNRYPLEVLLRPPVELWSAFTAGTAALIALLAPWALMMTPEVAFAAALALAFVAVRRAREAWAILRYQRNIRRLPAYTLPARKIPVSRRKLFLGRGFRWMQKHTQRLRDTIRPEVQRYIEPGPLYRWARRREVDWERVLGLKYVARALSVDALRAHLLREGHDGIPNRNDRIFDVLQEHGIAVSNGERAIWRARVAGDGWAHELTVLRVPAARVWPEPDRRPETFGGSVTPLEQINAPTNAKLEQQATPAPSHEHNAKEQTTRVTEQDESAIPIYMESRTTTEESSDTVSTSETAGSSDAGEQFLAWLRDGVASRRIQVNTVNARVHVVPEGVLLVSPGIFRDFAGQHPEHEWSNVQKRFQKLKLHRKTETGTNIHAYRVTGERKRSSINGLLLPDAAVVFCTSSPPLPNPHISRKE